MRSYPTDQAIWQLARDLGLDPFPVVFDSVPATVLYEFAAYLIPGRMSHWSYGKAYHLMKTRYDYGLNKLYEMVINGDPAYAFLLESNSDLENTFVRAHVMGHVDFFHHNQCFHHTSPDMIEVVTRHAERVRQYAYEFGADTVEHFLDAALALEEHVTPPAPNIRPRDQGKSRASGALTQWRDLSPHPPVDHVPEVRESRDVHDDLLLFLTEESHELSDWQRDVLSMVRTEMIYFWPQIRTKVMNEGWATYWHARLMRELALTDEDYLNFARLHAQVTSPTPYQLNPYAVGFKIYQWIAEHEGEDALFLARSVDDDVSFIRNYLTEEVADQLHLFVLGPEQDRIIVKSRAFSEVKARLVQDLVHGGIPVIHVNDGDFHHRGELYLVHRYEGVGLDVPYAERTLHYVHQLWGRPVHLETQSGDRRMVLSYDGKADSKVVL